MGFNLPCTPFFAYRKFARSCAQPAPPSVVGLFFVIDGLLWVDRTYSRAEIADIPWPQVQPVSEGLLLA